MEASRKTAATTMQSTLDNTVERVASGAHDAVDRVAGAASAATRQAGRKGEELLATGDRYVGQATEQIREHPFAALGIAALAGFLLSILVVRR